jgi:Protein of unknown function (DUF3300)
LAVQSYCRHFENSVEVNGFLGAFTFTNAEANVLVTEAATALAGVLVRLGRRMIMFHRRVRAILIGAIAVCLFPFGSVSYADEVPTGEQLTQLLAPIALYPDTLLAQICAASTDPQQIIDANNWLKQNTKLQGAALTEAAQKKGFDPAFISLVTFPAVLDTMAINIDDYAALGAAFKADQKSVMAAIQALRQQAYASGALDTNQYQKVSVEQQNGAQVVVVQPVNPQVVYVPVYQPQQVFVSAPSQSDVVAASLLSFGVGVAIGALINNNQPYGWGAWGWGWGGGGMYYHRSVFVVNNRYRSPYPAYRPRPPVYNRPGYPGYGRPPPNWNQRPGYRPPPPGYRPPRPPANGGGYSPPGNGSGYRPPANGGGSRPPTSGGSNRPPGSGGGSRPPSNGGATRPVPTAQPRPSQGNPFAGFPQGGNRQQGQRPSSPRESTGSRAGGLSANFSGKSERAASNRGLVSVGGGNRSAGQKR